MRIRILLALIAAVAIVGLWWIGRADPTQERRRELVEVPEPQGRVHVPVKAQQEEPEPEGIESGGEPADPVESGSCELVLRVIDAETHKPVRTEVTLWRLDAPGNEHWTPGDQIQAKELASYGIAHFRDLPPGNYRAVCSRRRVAGEDSRVLYVQGDSTEETIAILMPRKFRVYLKLFDLEGNPITNARIQRRGGSRTATKRDPKWRRPRRLVAQPDAQGGRVWHRRGSASLSRRWTDSTATEKGFLLGELEENQHECRWTYPVAVEVPGHARVMVLIDGEFEGERTYVGIAAPSERIRERILLPDGSRADEAGGHFAMWTRALRDDGSPPMARLRKQNVRVVIRVAGYEHLNLQYSVLEGPRAPKYLTAVAPAGRRQ